MINIYIYIYIYIFFYSKRHISHHFKHPHLWMTTALPVILRASATVGDNQMLQGLVWEAVGTWEPESMGLCSNSISSECAYVAPLGNLLLAPIAASSTGKKVSCMLADRRGCQKHVSSWRCTWQLRDQSYPCHMSLLKRRTPWQFIVYLTGWLTKKKIKHHCFFKRHCYIFNDGPSQNVRS